MDGLLLGLAETRKPTVLFVTHHVPEAVLLADQVVVLTARPSRILDVVIVESPRAERVRFSQTDAFWQTVARVHRLLRAASQGGVTSCVGSLACIGATGSLLNERLSAV